MLIPKIIDQFGGVSTFKVAIDGLLAPPAVSGSRPPYLFTNGEKRINGSSAVAYNLIDLASQFIYPCCWQIITQADGPDLNI